MRARAGSGFTTIRTEGGLVPPELLARVAAGDPDLEGIDAAAYHLAAGERPTEAISRSWARLLGAWTAFRAELEKIPDDDPATSVTRQRWTLVLFQELGYGQLQTAKAVEIQQRSFPVSHAWHAVPIHLVGANVKLDDRREGVAGAARTSPHGLVQEMLNASDERLWGFVTNGRQLRLLRDNVSLTRQAFVEFDLEAMLDGQAYADFVVLWLLCHQSRVEGEPPEKCVLERWVSDAAQRGTRALDQLREGVESAINRLGAGFLRHPQNSDLRERLRCGDLSTQDYYRQLLRLVYRLLFLFVAEDRDLLLRPEADLTTRQRYLDFYSTARLRRLAARRKGGPHGDTWTTLRLVCAALGRDDGEPALGLPGLGSFLWSERATPDLDDAQLANDALLGALRDLTNVRDGKTTRSVDYRNLGSEELGGIYESLLELHPELNADSGTFVLRVAAGNERKTTGSYYTPTSLINELLDSALEPVLAEAAASPNAEDAILALTVLDPACGSGHFLIAAAHRIARRLAVVRTGDTEPSPQAVREALRDVVGRCIHGIDVNEMAVELCKVSLWMEAVEPGKPLTFLEHRIVCGNALLGATPKLLADGVPDEAFKALEGDDKDVVKSLKAANKRERKGQGVLALGGGVGDLARPIADAIAQIDALPDDSVDAVHEKERQWDELQRSVDADRAKLAADAWCAAFVAPKVKGAPTITDGVVRQIAEAAETADPSVVDEVRRLAVEYRFVHFHLAFADVFSVPEGAAENQRTGWDGGFSVVLGNPPWERVKFLDQEWLAARRPDIAGAPNAAARRRMVAALELDDPELHLEYKRAWRASDGASHLLRASGRYPMCGLGRDINTASVFAETFRDAIGLQGRCGLVVPTGLATDDTTKAFFADLVMSKSLVSLLDFENRLGVFLGVHRSFKFSLLTIAGEATPVDSAEFVFFAHTVADLSDAQRRFVLTADDFDLVNPNTRTCPVFRSRRDAAIVRDVHGRVPVLLQQGNDSGNPWSIATNVGVFHMGNDAALFRTKNQLLEMGFQAVASNYEKDGNEYLRLYEGKYLHLYDHRWATNDSSGHRDTTPPERSDPSYFIEPRYFVPTTAFEARRQDHPGWVLGWRDVTNATNERTLIAAAFPRAAYSDKLPSLVVGTPGAELLLANLSAICLDYVARQKLGNASLKAFVLRQLPVIPPDVYQTEAQWTTPSLVGEWLRTRILELVFSSWDMYAFAADLNWTGPPFRWDGVRRARLKAEIDAAYFLLYGIKREDVDYIMETFPIIKRKDKATHGKYHTKRLILDCYDGMAKAIDTAEPYQTILDPPPADPTVCHPESSRPDWARALN